MSNSHYVEPQFNIEAFNCPHCKVLTHHTWFGNVMINDGRYYNKYDNHTNFSLCYTCNEYSIWYKEKMIYPKFNSSVIPDPNQDLLEDCKTLYNEAKDVYPISKRAAAALLRLCVESLCMQLGKTIDAKNSLDSAIRELVRDGLNPRIQQALDILRVVGNHAVHPGLIKIDDEALEISKLFNFINLIAKTLISDPKETEEVYLLLPEGERNKIEKKDNIGTV